MALLVSQPGTADRNHRYSSHTGTPAACPNPDSGSYTAGTTRYSYDANGNLSSKRGPKPNQPSGSVTTTTSYIYDTLNRLTQKSYDDGTTTVKYGYDGVAPSGCTPPTPVTISNSGIPLTPTNQLGRRSSMCDASGATTWIYDSVGHPSIERRTLNGATMSIGYQYNLDGSVWRTWYPSADAVYSYRTAAGRENGAHDNYYGVFHNAAFYPNGALREMSMIGPSFGGIMTERAYNKRLQPLLEYSVLGASPYTPLFKRCYDFHVGGGVSGSLGGFTCSFSGTTPGDNGDVYQIANKIDDNRTQNFTYDALNRIQQAYTNGTNWGETYSPNPAAPGAAPSPSGIDAWGNLTNRSAVTGKTYYEPLSCPANNKNQLTTCSLNYDAAGNVTSNGGASYVYDAENRITSAGGVTYTYDGDGKRVKKSSGTLYWTGVGSDTLSESDLSGTINAEYFYFNGQRVVRVDRPGNVGHFYLNDHLGTARIVATPTSNNTASVAESDYYPYGGEIPIAGSDPNHYKFTGKERDSETGLDDFGARYSASTMGRFMSPDPLLNSGRPWNPQTWNRYAYARNNPLAIVDPTGLYDFKNTCAPTDNACNAAFAQIQTDVRNAYAASQAAYDKAVKNGDTKAASALKRMLDGLGAEGQKNARGQTVNISIDLSLNASGHTTFAQGSTSTIDVVLNPNMANQAVQATVAHEGVHAGEIVPGKFNWGQAYSLEHDAFDTESHFSQAIGYENIRSPLDNSDMVNGVLDMSKDIYLWSTSWANVDAASVSALRSKGVDAAAKDAATYDCQHQQGGCK